MGQPAEQLDGKMGRAEADDGGINWKELGVDKSIDVILVPLGLFAALWFQGWVDDRKEQADYVLLLKDFKAELDANRAKAKAMEKDIGPVSDTGDEKVLGPMQVTFDEFRKEADEAAEFLECLDKVIEIGKKAPEALTPEEQKAAEACGKVLEGAESEGDGKKFQGRDLSPLYRYEVWQVYLSNGIKLFKDSQAKQIGLRLGEVYASAKEVEKRVAEIESIYNDSFMEKSGEVAAIEAEMSDLMPEEPTAQDLVAIQPKLAEFGGKARALKYEIAMVEGVLRLKVERLKAFVSEMDQKFEALAKDIDTEIGRNQ